MNPQVAEPWSLALGGAGRACIWLVVAFCLAASLAYLFSDDPRVRRVANWSFALGALSFIAAFVALAVLFVKHQFQFEYVFRHSAREHETQYLIAGVWSGQEGSFLLWGLMASIAGVLAAQGAGLYRRWFTVFYGAFLAGLAGILVFESPFDLIPLFDGKQLVPPDGMGMVPSLLNYWVVIHPPTIFFGFGVLTVLFAYALAAVARRDVVSWVPMVRPWAVLALAVLGLGLCMGGFWAYETLGWGGFWMWDPVENTSFVPWCAVVVFVHGMFVQQARKKWFLANVLFAALPFVLFCYGTFLTRSGFLGDTSVHNFTEMDPTARVLLVALSAASLVAFVVAVVANWRKTKPSLPAAPGTESPFFSRETFYAAGIWLVYGFAFVTTLGMSYPLIVRAFGRKPEVIEEGLYHQVLAWLFPPLMLLMAVAPFLTWKGLTFREMFSRITNSLAVAVGVTGFLLLWLKQPGFEAPTPDQTINLMGWKAPMLVSWVLVLSGLCLFVATGAFWRMLESWKKSKQTVGAMLAHFGVAMTLFGLIFSRGFEQEKIVLLHPSERPNVFGMKLVNEGPTSTLNDRQNKIAIEATSEFGKFVAKPTLYYYPDSDGNPKPMAWPSIQHAGLVDYYFAISEPTTQATDPTLFRLSNDPNNPDMRAHADIVLLYNSYTVEGSILEDGQSKLTAKMTVVSADRSYEIEPTIIVRAGEKPLDVPARIGDEYDVYLRGMDPKTHDIQVQLMYVQPAYPLQVFFKPLTLFVWLGVGIMTVGGLLSAAVRRKERLSAGEPQDDAS